MPLLKLRTTDGLSYKINTILYAAAMSHDMKLKFDPRQNKFAALLTRELFEATLPSIVLICLALFVAYKFIDPAPPRKIVMAVSNADLNYHAFASIYAVYLKREGITLETRASTGDAQNLAWLKSPDSDVDIAFMQDGAASNAGAGQLLSLGSLYYQPVWIFSRGKQALDHVADLKGKRIAIGQVGEGTYIVAHQMLSASGISAGNSQLLTMGGETAADALLTGQVDAAFFVDVATSPLIQSILAAPNIQLVNLADAEAYSRKYTYLHHLVLPEGAMDLSRNLPDRDVHLVAPTATLVIRESMHPALVYLMMKIIAQVHTNPSLFNSKDAFPSPKETDFPISTQALNFYKSGLPFIDKYLPFWAATFVNRTLIVIVPLLALLIPLTRLIPMVYVWLVKRKLFRFYGELRFLDAALKELTSVEEINDCLDKLSDIENKVVNIKLPVPFSQYAYELRAHIALVRNKCREQRQLL